MYGPEGDFDTTYASARKRAVAWVRKSEAEIEDGYAALEQERKEFREHVQRLREELEEQKRAEYYQIRQDKLQAQHDIDEKLRLMHRERDEHGPRILGEHRDRDDTEHRHGQRAFRLSRERHRREREAHEREQRMMFLHNVATESVVEVNVCGTLFAAPRPTLAQQRGSLLERWMSGRAPPPTDHSGRLFLDRDPALFRTILNFLRDPAAPPMPGTLAESQALCREADYLGIRFFPFPLVYVLGGHDGVQHLDTVELLDIDGKCWRSCQPMPMERTFFGAEVFQSQLHLFGGQNREYKALCETSKHDCLRGEWVAGASLGVPRRNCASAQDGNRIYAIGGFDGDRIMDSVETFDPRMKSWQTVSPLTVPRSSAAAAFLGGRLWVLGGTSGRRLQTVEVFDPRANRWETFPISINESRSAGTSCVCRDRLYAMGGINESNDIVRTMECFDQREAHGGHWTYARSMRESRMDFAACEINQMIMVSGGQHGNVLASTEFYRPDLNDWQFGPSLLGPRYGHRSLVVSV